MFGRNVEIAIAQSALKAAQIIKTKSSAETFRDLNYFVFIIIRLLEFEKPYLLVINKCRDDRQRQISDQRR